MSTLSDRLKQAISESAYSQAALAKHCSVKPPSVSAWLSGRTKNLRGENLVCIASALGVNIAWLADGTGPMRPDASGLAASEPPSPAYMWPFKQFTFAQYHALPAADRAQVERYALLLITDWERRVAEKSKTAA